MEGETDMVWELGHVLSNVLWEKGECLESPKIKSKDGTSWWLDFYPAGDNDDTDGLVFWLNRSDVDKAVNATFEIQLCFYTIPVRQYTLQHIFEEAEESHKWVIDDVKSLAQLKIFIPTSSLCILGFLTASDIEKSAENGNSEETAHNLYAITA